MAVPIAKDAINNGAQVELGAESVKHQSMTDVRGSKGSLVYLEDMGVLWQLHPGVNDQVQLDGYLVALNGLKRPGDEHIVCLWSSGTGHGDNRRR